MEPAVVISGLMLAVGIATFLWNRRTYHTARKAKLRVIAEHDGAGMDVYEAVTKIEHVISVQLVNEGERSEYVKWLGLETPGGDPLAEDRPQVGKLIDAPPPESQEVPARGHREARFKLPASATSDGFVGYAVLGTGKRIYSELAQPNPEFADIHAELLRLASEAQEQGEHRR